MGLWIVQHQRLGKMPRRVHDALPPPRVVAPILHPVHRPQVLLVHVATVERLATQRALQVVHALAFTSVAGHVVPVAHHLTARAATEPVRLALFRRQGLHRGLQGSRAVSWHGWEPCGCENPCDVWVTFLWRRSAERLWPREGRLWRKPQSC